MYKYYQIGNKSHWVLIEENDSTEQRAIDAGARKLTMLSVSEVIGDDTKAEDLSHKGDQYYDIDCKDLAQAIISTQDLVAKHRYLGVPDAGIRLFASGKKGFHVVIPSSIFSTGRALKSLPAIYKEMALELYVPGMDFQVYSGGRGICWRLINIQRDDGNYRVPITLDELADMTPEWYMQLVSTPRILPTPDLDRSLKAPAMEALMTRAKKRVKDRPAQPDPIADERLADFKDEPPPCISDLVEYKVKPSKNFNEASFQLGIFIARSGMDEAISSSLVARIAVNGQSNAYATPRAREDHSNGLVSYLRSTKNRQFACNAMRAVISTRPCEDCSLCSAGEEEAEIGEDVGLVGREDGYYVLGANGERRVSTFTLRAVNVYLELSQADDVARRVGATVEVMRGGEVIDNVHFYEHGWATKSHFKHELKGISNLAFYGTEDDIQRIKHITLDEGNDMGEIVQVQSAGMHYHKIGGRMVRVYVEPGLSVNQYRVRGTHVMANKVTAAPAVREVDLPADGDEDVSETLLDLMHVNTPLAVSQMLGWFSACHLKLHLMKRYKQFPLLSLWGAAGSGKSMTSALFAWLNGSDFSMENSPFSMASITPWAMISYCSSTTTVPRILEEYNKSKIVSSRYAQLGEFMKMAWGGQAVARGGIKKTNANGGGSGSVVHETILSSPLLLISEQAPDSPALQQRCVQVQLNPADIHGRETAFFTAVAEQERLKQMAKALVYSALSTDIEWVEETMEQADALLTEELRDRPRYSYQVIVLGLIFFKKVCMDLKLSQEVIDEVDSLLEQLQGTIEEKVVEIVQAKFKTEIDIVLDDIGLMAQMTINAGSGGTPWLVRDTHYIIRGRRIYFHTSVLFGIYKLYKGACREPLVIDSPSQFKALIQQEPYYITANSIDGARALHVTKGVMELDLDRMEAKGLDISLYG